MAENNGAATEGRAENGQFDGRGADNPGRPLGSPNKAAWIRDQILETCDEKRITELKQLDPKLYWDVVCKLMPKQVQAEVGAMGSIGAACQAALREAGITDGKTRLGTLSSEAELNAIPARHDNSSNTA